MRYLVTIIFLASSILAFSQNTFNIQNLRISAYSHNFQCGDDGGFFNFEPEPRFKVEWREQGVGSFGSTTFISTTEQTCGTYNVNNPLSPSTFSKNTAASSVTLEFQIEAWEEDDCGDNDTYDDDCTFNDDDNQSIDTETITFSTTDALGGGSQTFTLGNGYTITIAWDAVVLPVELITFNGKVINSEVELHWQTATEQNSFEFEVQRSTNGKQFRTIDIMDAAGTSLEEIAYHFTDETPLPFAYYRLKMVDLDGSFEYSDIISVEFSDKEAQILNVYPNPADDQLTVDLILDEPSTLRVLDLNGKVVIEQSLNSDNQLISSQLDVSNLPAGQYILIIISSNNLMKELFIVK